MPVKISDIDETQAPLLDHLIELRTRLVRCVLALVLSFCVCVYFASDIFGFLVRPLDGAFPAGQGRLIFTQLGEAFFVELKVALFAAFFVSFPIIANQLWAFVAPGLYAQEKRAFLPFLIATPVLFVSGGALAYYFVMPTAFRWFLGFEGQVGGLPIEALPAAGDYLTLVMQFILAFGISFLLPVLLLLLNRADLIRYEQLRRARRYVIVGILIVAAVLTPPDPGSQIMLAVPLYLLFEASLLLMRLGERRKRMQTEAEQLLGAADQALPSAPSDPEHQKPLP